MQAKALLFGLIILIAGVMITPLVAQEDEYNPVPFTPEENACYTGGSMWRENPADGCVSDWHWDCGWYLARFENGIYSRDEVPLWCDTILPAPFVAERNIVTDVETGITRVTSCTWDGRPNGQNPYQILIASDWEIAFDNQVSIRLNVTSTNEGNASDTTAIGIADTTNSYLFTFNNAARPGVTAATVTILDGNQNTLLTIACSAL